jgi:SAM-dependent methyltransferase
MEYVGCDLCNKDEPIRLFTTTDINYTHRGIFDIVRCKNCGLVYTNPRPNKEELNNFYPNEYYCPPEEPKEPNITSPPHINAIKRLVSLRAKGKILDIGCAIGGFLYVMRKKGWQAYGVEISTRNSKYAREKFGLNVFTGELLEADYPKGYFDVVTLWHVLEHFPNPTQSLHEIHRILKDDGELIICVPNIRSVEAKLFGKRWYHWDIPRHLYHFDYSTLKGLLEKTHFKIVKIDHCPIPTDFRASLVYWIRDLLRPTKNLPSGVNPSGFQHNNDKYRPLKNFINKTLDIIFAPLCYFLAKIHLSGMITVYAKKDLTNVCVLVNGSYDSAMGIRARGLTKYLNYKTDILYRDKHKIFSLFRFFNFIRKKKPKIVYVMNIGYSGVIAGILAKWLYKIKLIVDTGDVVYELFKTTGQKGFLGLLLTKILENSALRLSDVIIVRGSFS